MKGATRGAGDAHSFRNTWIPALGTFHPFIRDLRDSHFVSRLTYTSSFAHVCKALYMATSTAPRNTSKIWHKLNSFESFWENIIGKLSRIKNQHNIICNIFVYYNMFTYCKTMGNDNYQIAIVIHTCNYINLNARNLDI